MESQQAIYYFIHLMKNHQDNFEQFLKLKEEKTYRPQIWYNYVDLIYDMLVQQPLPFIITLHHYKILDPFLKYLCSIIFKSQEPNERLWRIFTIIYHLSYECFLKQFDKEQERKKIEKISLKISQSFTQNKTIISNRTKQFQHILQRLLIIKNIEENTKLRKELNQFLFNILLLESAHTLWEQVAFNWIKHQVQIFQKQKDQNICCKIHFQHRATSNTSKFIETSNHQFKDYRWPLENDSIKFHLTKTIVGFMNTDTGGIIYVGIKEDKTKVMENKGIELNDKEKQDFLYFLHDDIIKGVYPKEEQRRKDQQLQSIQKNQNTSYRKKLKQEFNFSAKRKSYEFKINRYVYVDFMDVYEPDTYLNSKNKEGSNLYIVRIKVKIGDKRQLYHVINSKDIPEAYIRQDKSVKKKTLEDFYILFYQRVKKNNQKFDKYQHQYCRFNARCIETG